MIAFIGAGKVGTSLGIYFKRNGYKIAGYFSRTTESATNAAALTDSETFDKLEQLATQCNTIWITTSDDAIESTARQLASLTLQEKKTIIHASGLLTTDSLHCLKEQGHYVCSAHPLLAFSNSKNAAEMLPKTYFFLEGDTKAVKDTELFFNKLGNNTVILNREQKTAYHTAVTMVSNYLVCLVNCANRIFDLAGIKENELRQAENVLMASVLNNLSNKAPKDALTGPIRRGDTETVKKHIELLENNLPDICMLYKALGRETMNMIGDYRLKNILEL